MEGWSTLDAAELRRALDVMRRVVPDNQLHAHAALWHEPRTAVLRIAGIEARIPAEGQWKDVVMTHAGFFLLDHERLPASGTICFHVERDRISVGGSSDRCWRRGSREDWPRFIDQLQPFAESDLLRFALSYEPRDLAPSGLLRGVRNLVEHAPDWIDYALEVYDAHALEDWEWGKQSRAVIEALMRIGLEQVQGRLTGGAANE